MDYEIKEILEKWIDEKCVVKRRGIERLYREADIRDLVNTVLQYFDYELDAIALNEKEARERFSLE